MMTRRWVSKVATPFETVDPFRVNRVFDTTAWDVAIAFALAADNVFEMTTARATIYACGTPINCASTAA